MQTNRHDIDGVEIAFVSAAAVSLVALVAATAWALLW